MLHYFSTWHNLHSSECFIGVLSVWLCIFEQDKRGSERPNISWGLEPLPVHVLNHHMLGVMPKEFVYITTSLHVNSKADLMTLLKNPQICGVCCQCQEDCLGHLCPCGLDMGGIYQYTKKGLLNEAWSGKHKEGSVGFITECNEGCGCSEGCSNRVVQRGMTSVVYYDVTERNRVAMSRHRHNVASRHYDGSRRCCYSGIN
jgi:hypothetical protein